MTRAPAPTAFGAAVIPVVMNGPAAAAPSSTVWICGTGSVASVVYSACSVYVIWVPPVVVCWKSRRTPATPSSQSAVTALTPRSIEPAPVSVSAGSFRCTYCRPSVGRTMTAPTCKR